MAIHFRRSLLRTLPLLLALAGCGPASPNEAGSEPARVKADIRIANSLSTDALVLNAISTNPTANGALASSALGPLFDPVTGNTYMRMQLRDPDAQQFMEYLVSCALKTGQDLPWYDPLTSTTRVWHGKAGLCQSWATAAPSLSCQRRVSACILARNNALGRRVELSMRGEYPGQPGIFSLETVTQPAEYDPDTSQRLASFSACTTSTQGVSRSCGWKTDAIGQCTPYTPVSVGAGGVVSCPGSALGSTSGARTVLRVCAGTVGCESGGTRFLGESDGSCAGTAPVVSFTCPEEGYFSVMAAPWDSSTVGSANVDMTSGASAAYGMSEAQVYSVREGAFYGNLFVPKALATTVEVRRKEQGGDHDYEVVGDDAIIPGAIYKQMYSCYDPAWTSGMAYSAQRVCALPSSGANCAATVTGPCWDPVPSLGRCATQDGSMVTGDGDFEQCRDPGNGLWMEPVTVFLHQACESTSEKPDDSLCSRRSPKVVP